MKLLREHVKIELRLSDEFMAAGDHASAFHYLERAHVLGQSMTFEHTRIHWRMLKLGRRMKNWAEVCGQLLRILGASTKTPFGIYPTGNTGGSNVPFYESMPIPDDLQKILAKARIS